MNQKQPLTFNDYSPGPNFDRARIGIATPFQYLDIDLTNAAVNQMFDISGDFLYFDTADGYDGIITLELNNEHNAPLAPFTGRPGFALNALFKRLKLSWQAQPGKSVRIMYSTGERVIPALTGTLIVTNTITAEVEPITWTNTYQSTTNMAASTPDTVFAPGANVNGAILHKASFNHVVGAGSVAAGFLAKAGAAPASVIDGNVLVGVTSTGQSTYGSGFSEKDMFIPAGMGLYYINAVAGTLEYRHAVYTLLP